MFKDRLLWWFMRNMVLPRQQIIDKPGFITKQLKLTQKGLFNRSLLLPEGLFVSLEKEITDKNLLYCIGKKFGWAFSFISNLPKFGQGKKEEVLDLAFFLVRYIESLYSREMSHEMDYDTKMFTLKMKDYIVCSKNGSGYLFSTGGVAGIWAYACEDPSIEAVQPKCQGRGDSECVVVAAPYDVLVAEGYNPVKCVDLEGAGLGDEYLQFNQVRPAEWATNSLRGLIDSGFLEYAHGQMVYKGERFFLVESSFMYILEKELKKLPGGLEVLWDVSFDFGERLAGLAGRQDPCKFVMDFFPALGFGDILAVKKKGKYELFVKYFPWTKWVDEVDFTMFRGLVSGVISGLAGEKVELKNVEKDVSAGYLFLHVTQ